MSFGAAMLQAVSGATVKNTNTSGGLKSAFGNVALDLFNRAGSIGVEVLARKARVNLPVGVVETTPSVALTSSGIEPLTPWQQRFKGVLIFAGIAAAAVVAVVVYRFARK